MLGGEEGGQSMSNPVNRDTLIAYIEEKSGMNIPGWLQEVIMSCPADVDALENAYAHGWTGAESEYREALDRMTWIPCSERLPEKSGEVLTCFPGGWIEINELVRHAGEYHWENQHGDWTDLDEAIAWMPLPESYDPDVDKTSQDRG